MQSASSSMPAIRTEQLSEPFTYKTMELIESERPSREEQPHRHDYFVILFTQKVKGHHQVDFKAQPLQDNTVYFVSPEQVHHVEVEGQPQGHVLLFTPDFLQQYSIFPHILFEMELFFNCDEAPPITIAAEQVQPMEQLLQQIRVEYKSKSWKWLDSVGALLKLFLIQCQRYKRSSAAFNEKWESRQAQIVRQFKKEVEAYYKKIHKVADYANFQNLSSAYLNEVIKGETGASAKEYIQHRIVLEAKRLALYSDWTMKQIAWELGFEDTAHFSRLFKKYAQLNFSEWREGK